MLKSHFSIKHDDDEEVIEEELVATPSPTAVEEEEVELQKEYEERKLHQSEISVRLSWIGKTADGDGYAYLKAKCTDMKLTDISSITLFKHLQFIDVSKNYLTIEALQVVTQLPHLLLIRANRNKLTSANLNRCKYLQVIIMNNNELVSVDDVFQPELCTLEVAFNKITEIKFLNRMPTLRVLDFRHNLIHHLTDLNFPNLDSLYLAGNKLTNLQGIENLRNLRILHVRNNPIRYLHGFETVLPKLEYLNLRNCKIGTLRQVKKLKNQPSLSALILKGNPYMGGSGKEDPETADEEEDPEIRVEVLATLPRLKRLNKTEYTPEERTEAKDLMTQWLEEGEKDDEEEVVEEAHEEEAQPEYP